MAWIGEVVYENLGFGSLRCQDGLAFFNLQRYYSGCRSVLGTV